WIERHMVDPAAARGAFLLVDRQFDTVGPGRTTITVPLPDNGHQLYVRTFVVRGEGSGILLRHGETTAGELAAADGRWSIERSIAPGATTAKSAVAIVPPGTRRVVATLVYERYQ